MLKNIFKTACTNGTNQMNCLSLQNSFIAKLKLLSFGLLKIKIKRPTKYILESHKTDKDNI